MIKPRDNAITVIFGGLREGKSTWIATNIIPLYFKKGLKVKIVQTKYNPAYAMYENDDRVQIIFIRTLKEVKEIMYYSVNCALICEEATIYMGESLDENTKGVIVNCSQCNVDLFFVIHSYSFCSRDIFRFRPNMAIFPCGELPDVRKEYFSKDELQEINAALLKLKKYEPCTLVR